MACSWEDAHPKLIPELPKLCTGVCQAREEGRKGRRELALHPLITQKARIWFVGMIQEPDQILRHCEGMDGHFHSRCLWFPGISCRDLCGNRDPQAELRGHDGHGMLSSAANPTFIVRQNMLATKTQTSGQHLPPYNALSFLLHTSAPMSHF